MTVRVALVGCGAWGENLLRTLVKNPRAEVVAVADTSPARLDRAAVHAPHAALVPSLEAALALAPTAIVIATPSTTHAALALTAMDAGADVFVEKPLALSSQDADACAARAIALGRVAMVGHLLRYHPAVVRMVALAREGQLGELRHFAAARLRSGGDFISPILWSLGPHDVSILRAIDPSPIVALDAQCTDDGVRVNLDLRLESGLTARIELARLNPTKERRLSIAGSARIALFDDVRAPDCIAVGEANGRDAPRIAEELRVPWREPLALEMDHFFDCIEQRAAPLTSFDDGAAVVRVLARAESLLPRRAPAAIQPSQRR